MPQVNREWTLEDLLSIWLPRTCLQQRVNPSNHMSSNPRGELQSEFPKHRKHSQFSSVAPSVCPALANYSDNIGMHDTNGQRSWLKHIQIWDQFNGPQPWHISHHQTEHTVVDQLTWPRSTPKQSVCQLSLIWWHSLKILVIHTKEWWEYTLRPDHFKHLNNSMNSMNLWLRMCICIHTVYVCAYVSKS